MRHWLKLRKIVGSFDHYWFHKLCDFENRIESALSTQHVRIAASNKKLLPVGRRVRGDVGQV